MNLEAIQIIETIVKTIRSEISHHRTDIAQKDTYRQKFAQTLWSQYTEYMVIHKFHSEYFSRLLRILDDNKSKVFRDDARDRISSSYGSFKHLNQTVIKEP